MGTPVDIHAVLHERGENYGDFQGMAEIAQRLKTVLTEADGYGRCNAYQRESLDLICTKLARIVNGNPDHEDSWTDIAGYAKLVADQLPRHPREADRSEQSARQYKACVEMEDAFRNTKPTTKFD